MTKTNASAIDGEEITFDQDYDPPFDAVHFNASGTVNHVYPSGRQVTLEVQAGAQYARKCLRIASGGTIAQGNVIGEYNSLPSA